MRGMKHLSVRVALVALVVVGLVAFVAACGGSSATTTTTLAATTTTAGSTVTTAPSSPEAVAIMANWVKFFDGTTAAADKTALLENGQQYATQIQAQASSPLAKSLTAIVTSITVDSATTATVKYSLALAGTVALPDQTGQAILQDNVWKVSAQSFQALLTLESASVPSST